MPPLHLLLSSRDPGAAKNILEIAHSAGRHPEMRISAVAAQPAYQLLVDGGIDVSFFDAPFTTETSGEAYDRNLTEAGRRLDELSPDAILAGLSSSGEGGVDEALIKAAQNRMPTFAVQDYWGDVNDFFGASADIYFVQDELAKDLTTELHGKSSIVTAPPCYASYGKYEALTTQIKTAHDSRRPVIGIFGQALWAQQGYHETLSELCHSIHRTSPGAIVRYRPHQRESAEDRLRALALFEQHDLDVELHPGQTIEEDIISCHTVLSVFSNSGRDALYLNRVSSTPLASTVFLQFDENLHRHYRSLTGSDEIPLVVEGMALCARTLDGLDDSLKTALSDEERNRQWRLAREKLADPTAAPDKILSCIRKQTA